MNVRYRVTLTQCERDELWALLSGGKHPARRLTRAQILLAADSGVSDEDIAASIGVGGSTVYRTKRRFVESNLDLDASFAAAIFSHSDRCAPHALLNPRPTTNTGTPSDLSR